MEITLASISDGVWPTMITPFNDQNEIDYPGIQQLLTFYAQRKVDGVFAICQSSEMFFLSLEERVKLTRFISENLPDGMEMIISGHTADSIPQQAEEAKAMLADLKNIKAYVILPNRFAEKDESDEVLIRGMEEFIQLLPDVPLGLYECPYPYKRLVTPNVLEWCLETNRFLFLKDTCCDIDMIAEKLTVIKGSPIKFFNANSATLLDSLRLGGNGFSGVMANFHPEIYHQLESDISGEIADDLQSFLGVASLIERQNYPINAKDYLNQCGLSLQLQSRSGNVKEYSKSQKNETSQLYHLSEQIKQQYGIRI